MFLAVEVSRFSAWLLIPVLALGVVARLATVVLALRAVATELGAPDLLRRVAPAEAVDDDRDAGLARLMTLTLLPFLGIYAAFGYVNVFARDVVILATYSYGPFGDTLLSRLNPLESGTTAAITVALAIGLFVSRRLLDRWHERTGRAWIGLLAVLVEASGLFVVLLSGFRLWEQAQLWLGERRLAQWVPRIDLPDLLDQAWAFVAGTVWPVFWDLVSQPIAWLALAALVFGSRILSLDQLWHTGGRTRRVVLQAQEVVLGDVNDKYLPAWVALRLVLRAGVPFLGAFVLLFSTLRLAGEWTTRAIVAAIGGAPAGTWIRLDPFLDLVPDVVVFSLQLALLGAAYVRILTLRAQPAPAGPPAPRRRMADVGVVGALLVAITALVLLNPGERTAVRTSAVGQSAPLLGGRVVVDGVRLGSSLALTPGSSTATTPLVFVVVEATAVRPGAAPILVGADLVNGAHTYHAGGWASSTLTAEPGFTQTGQLVFEVQPADIGPGLELHLSGLGFLTSYDEVVRVPLGLATDAPVTTALPVDPTTRKAVA
ncbi:MAG: hypothetical protein LCH96_03010 [Actinobacteria bacterium]|nr:hypothetical protein [Actinomycetota bacterium]